MSLIGRLLVPVVVPVITVSGLAALPAPAAAQVIDQAQVVSAIPAKKTPHVLDGAVKAIVQTGNTIIAGGNFTTVQEAGATATLARRNLFAFDAITGKIDPNFAPQVDNQVYALAVAADGASVYVGGAFNYVNGVRSPSLARLDVATGTSTAGFKTPPINGVLNDLAVRAGRLYIGGNFTAVKGIARPVLASLDAVTGAVDPYVDLQVAGPLRGGALSVAKTTISPDGTRLVLIGNFSSVAGLPRVQLAVIDLTGPTATVANWATHAFEPNCALVFDTYLRDVDISPDGSYFVIPTTGAYRGTSTLCDSVSRWELRTEGTDIKPTWVNWTGGDTAWTVAITSAAVYVGGHFRWLNNPFAGDRAGPGAVPRSGIAAVDPINGLPLSWNPGRSRGVAVWDMLVTDTGLWVGSDTDRLANRYHGRIGFFPLAGGTTIPRPNPGTLPGDVHLAGRAVPASATNVLYRINAAGPPLLATDDGPDWAGDTATLPSTLHNTGSTATGYSTSVAGVTAAVPPGTPRAVFTTERWDNTPAPELAWSFPVPAGRHVAVRLYFANRCTCTRTVGSRTFDVTIDGTRVLTGYDIVADAGDNIGTAKTFAVTSDGSVDVLFGHRVQHPLVNAVEVIDLDAGTPALPPSVDEITRRGFDGSSTGPGTAIPPSGIAWRSVRGGFMLNGNLYTGSSDGNLYARSYDGTTFGAPRALNLYALTAFSDELRNATAMLYDGGRLYFTQAGSPTLYYRYFTPESGIVGAMRYVADAGTGGVDWSRVTGIVHNDGALYFAADDGNLRRIRWSGSALVGPPSAPISGPAVDGTDWRARAMFLFAPAG